MKTYAVRPLVAPLFLALTLLAAPSLAQNQVYDSSNPTLAAATTNNLLATNAPVLGNPGYTMEIQGLPPAAFVILDMSLGPSDIALPPYGALLINPAGLFWIRTTVSQPVPGGTAFFFFSIPANPALLGVSVYTQCGVFTAVQFTLTWGLQTTFF
jgi:hypothetical protein